MIAKELLELRLSSLKSTYSYEKQEADNLRKELNTRLEYLADFTNTMLQIEKELLTFCEHKSTTTEVDIAEYGDSTITVTTVSCDDCDKIISTSTMVVNA